MTRSCGLAAIAVVALTLAGCSSSGDEPQAPGEVVHVRVRFAGAPGFEEQWVELRTGRYRLQSPDGREWWVFDGRRRFEDRISGATTLRIGSRLYLDGLATMSVRELLAAYYLHGRRLVAGHGGHVLALRRHGHTIATITIAGALSSAQADERGLFRIRPALATSIDREAPAGARSTLDIAAYWYGPRWRRLTPLAARSRSCPSTAAPPSRAGTSRPPAARRSRHGPAGV